METFEAHYESLRATLDKYMPGADLELINRAVEYADAKHASQKRKDGSPYIIHPLAVAEVVVEMGLDIDAILGALLHDCIEDTDASHDEIEKLFGQTVAELVEGVTKLTRANFSTSEQAQMFDEMFTGANYKENYQILNNYVKSMGDTIPPLIHSYIGVSDTMKTFGTTFDPDFGDCYDTAMMITIADIYKEKYDRYIASYFK